MSQDFKNIKVQCKGNSLIKNLIINPTEEYVNPNNLQVTMSFDQLMEAVENPNCKLTLKIPCTLTKI